MEDKSALISFIGHSTILIEMDGVRLLTDPLFGTVVGPLVRLAPPPEPEQLEVDVVLISHLHGDHFDMPSLRKIGRETRIVVPKGAGPYLKVRRFQDVEEIEEGEVIEIGRVKVSATRADHGGRKIPWMPSVEPLGYVIDGSQEIYFAGDTDLFPEMVDIGISLDLALLPVWGWGPNLGEGHMDPERAAEALSHLRPRYAIPIHWGSYCPAVLHLFRPKFISDPPLAFKEHVVGRFPEVSVEILQPGATFQLPE